MKDYQDRMAKLIKAAGIKPNNYPLYDYAGCAPRHAAV
jgi:hypothetical protein